MLPREVEFYADADGWSEAAEKLAWVARADTRGFRAIESKIGLLTDHATEDLLRSQIVKKPTPTIYVLRVQSGPVAYRLPFFEPMCRGGRLIVFTHLERRADLRRGRYERLIEEAEIRRQDWIERNCK